MTVNIIDPHLHLFNYSSGDYHWLKTENPPFWSDKLLLQRDFSVEDLIGKGEIKLAGFVHIEAGFDNTKPWRELAYIESIPDQNNRTIAGINLLAPPADFQRVLQQLQQYQSLIGVRHILDEHAYTILVAPHAQQNFSTLNKIKNFIFELQLPLADNNAKRVMPLLMQIISNNKQLSFVINHAGFPPSNINSDAGYLWQQHMNVLAKYPNVFIKCSGWEMENRHYTMSWFSEVTRFCISTFSIDRVMLASNFPLCCLRNKLGNELGSEPGNGLTNELNNKKFQQSYTGYWQNIIESGVIKQCNETEKSALLYNNALNIYQLK